MNDKEITKREIQYSTICKAIGRKAANKNDKWNHSWWIYKGLQEYLIKWLPKCDGRSSLGIE